MTSEGRGDGGIRGSLASTDGKGVVHIEARSAYGAGVQIHVEDLADHLAGRERRDDVKARWGRLHPAYQALAINLS